MQYNFSTAQQNNCPRSKDFLENARINKTLFVNYYHRYFFPCFLILFDN
jgi:hypothetical protein